MIGIYKLIFEGLEDWPYIGQSCNIQLRYASHLSTLGSGKANKKMLEAYGIAGNPKLEVLEECREFDLDVREAYWIKAYDSINNGLNLLEGGKCFHGKGLKHYNSKYTRDQIVKGMHLLLNNTLPMTEVAKEIGMPIQALYNIKAGVTHQWFQEEFPEVFLEVSQIQRRKTGYNHQRAKYTKEQILEAFKYLQNPALTYSDIAALTDVSTSQISSIARGKTHQWLQDEFPKEYIKIQDIYRAKHATYLELEQPKEDTKTYHYFMSPSKDKYKVSNLSEHARKHDLTRQGLQALTSKAQKTHKGWRLCTEEEKLSLNTSYEKIDLT